MSRNNRDQGPAEMARTISIYEGRERLGRIDIFDDGEAHAFDCQGNKLGMFPNLKAACAAIKRPGAQP